MNTRAPWYGFDVIMTPDEVLAELHRIRDEQRELDPASARYAELEGRRQELAAGSAAALDATKGRQALQAELDHLEQRLAAIDDDKIEIPDWQLKMTRGGRFAINDPRAHASQINATLDKNSAADRTAIEARIDLLRRTLAE